MTAIARPAAALALATVLLAAPGRAQAPEADAPPAPEAAGPQAPAEDLAAPGGLSVEARLAVRAEFDDPRPPAAAYVVLDGARIETPLSETPGDPARGAAIFADPEAGGCVACHAAPGRPAEAVIPRLLRERLPALAAVPEDDGDAPVPPPDAFADATEAAPVDTPLPRPNPGRLPERAAPDPLAAPDVDLPPVLPLPQGPDLAGVAARLDEAELRLILVNPRLRDPASPMPAYHHVDLRRAALAPGFRQPWLSPVQVEDVLAWLMTLDAAPEAPADPPPPPAE